MAARSDQTWMDKSATGQGSHNHTHKLCNFNQHDASNLPQRAGRTNLAPGNTFVGWGPKHPTSAGTTVAEGEGQGEGEPNSVWNPKQPVGRSLELQGGGEPRKALLFRGDQWGQNLMSVRAPTAAFAAVAGKGSTLPWGGRGRGWDRGVPLAPYRSNPPGSSPRGKGPTLLGNRWGETWTSKGEGHLKGSRCLGGDQRGHSLMSVRAPSAASAVTSGRVARLWGGRGRGWDRRVHLVPGRSNPPGCSLRGEGLASLGSKGGKAWGGKGKGQVGRDSGRSTMDRLGYQSTEVDLGGLGTTPLAGAVPGGNCGTGKLSKEAGNTLGITP